MSLAGYVPKVVPGASPFGALLKQSKFASFDPQIAQLYTAYGGHAHRGDFGLKRPIGVRRRGAAITVKKVDSHEQQTEWNSAETQATFVRNFDDARVPARADPFSHERGGLFGFGSGAASRYAGETLEAHSHVDSEFAPNTSDTARWALPALKNYPAMRNVHFRRHEDALRRRRASGDFAKFAAEYLRHRGGAAGAGKKAGTVDLYALANDKDFQRWYELYGRQLAREQRADPKSRLMLPVPHAERGLSYAHLPPLQTFLTTGPRRGRILDNLPADRGREKALVASYAGYTGVVRREGGMATARMVDWDALAPSPSGQTNSGGSAKGRAHNGEAMLRVASATTLRAPRVVGRTREGLKAARISMELHVWDGALHERSNDFRPGSRKYVAAEPAGVAPTSPWGRGSAAREASAALLRQKMAARLGAIGGDFASGEQVGGSRTTLNILEKIVGGAKADSS